MPREEPLKTDPTATRSTRDLLTRVFAAMRMVYCPCHAYGTNEDRGRCSAIPPCCRRWFVEVWCPLDLDVKRLNKDVWSLLPDGWNWGYIPCPGCRQCGALVQVRRCFVDRHGRLVQVELDARPPDVLRALFAAAIKRRVMEIFREHPLGLTDEQMLVVYQRKWPTFGRSLESRASPRKRRSDLTRAGLIVDSGERRRLSSGRMGVVWKLAIPAELSEAAG